VANLKYDILGQIPANEAAVDRGGIITRPWITFFNYVKNIVDAEMAEKFFTLENDVSTPTAIEGMSFKKEFVSLAAVRYLIQRITTGVGAVDLIESGTFHLVYRPFTDTWEMHSIGTGGPDTSGVTLTVNSDGQVEYESTDETGTASIFRIIWKTQILNGKHYQYSAVGSVR
jgi:hypothetical protein